LNLITETADSIPNSTNRRIGKHMWQLIFGLS